MSLIGQVFNRALSKNIAVYVSESGDSFRRLTGAIGQDVKDAALAKVKESFESGKLFKEDDMKQMEQVTITNMSHQSQGETASGSKVKGGHVAEDPTKQTASFCIVSRDP